MFMEVCMLKYAIIFFAGVFGIMVFVLHTDTAFSKEATSAKSLLTQKCASCHGLGKVQKSLGKDSAQWQSVIQHMREKGAKLTDQEQSALAEYLGGLKAGDTL